VSTAALKAFDALPLKERLFVRGRLFTAPLLEVSQRVPSGRIVDVGCGHGLMVSLLASGRPERTVVGIDPDGRKIDWAKASVGALPNVSLEVGTVEGLAARAAGTFDAVVVCDVLYLLPRAEWRSFLTAAHALLKPGGVLLLKEAEASWFSSCAERSLPGGWASCRGPRWSSSSPTPASSSTRSSASRGGTPPHMCCSPRDEARICD
jgi:SAM-dependent methyltransferase